MNEETEDLFEEILLWSGEDDKLLERIRRLEEMMLESEMDMDLMMEAANELELFN